MIIGTAKLSDEQMKFCEKASHIIPIFKGGNFRFAVKSFIDSVVDYAKTCDENDILLILASISSFRFVEISKKRK